MIADRYLIEDVLGSGTFGRVYRARHVKLSRRFAVKVLFGDHATDPRTCERFEREAETASRLDHPNLVSVVDFGRTDAGLLYLVMDFIEGRDLAQIIHSDFPLGADRVRMITRLMVQGLAHAHDQGLVHRDLKPENVMVTESEDGLRVRIVDFGIARIMDDEIGDKLTQEGTIIGTPAYMAPEQARLEPVDSRTDLFALGIILYQMLAGKLPYDGEPRELAVQNATATPPTIAERVPGLEVDLALENLAHMLMAKVPADRPGSARDVLAALESPTGAPWLSDAATERSESTDFDGPEGAALVPMPDRAEPLPADTRVVVPSARTRRPVWIAVPLAILAVVAIAMVLSTGDDERPSATAPGEPTEGLLAVDPGAQDDAAVNGLDPAIDTPVVSPDAGAPTGPETDGDDDALESIRNASGDDDRTATQARGSARVARTSAGAQRDRVDDSKASERDRDDESETASATPPTKAGLMTLYTEVGKLLRERADRLGGARSRYESRYADIPILDASRNESLRADAVRRLKKLRREILSHQP